ncbi:hypothetical protein YC2023_093638 [Brassica napus]
MREVELLACNKKTKKSYDNMVTRLRWEAACVGNSDSVRALYDNSAPIFVKSKIVVYYFSWEDVYGQCEFDLCYLLRPGNTITFLVPDSGLF